MNSNSPIDFTNFLVTPPILGPYGQQQQQQQSHSQQQLNSSTFSSGGSDAMRSTFDGDGRMGARRDSQHQQTEQIPQMDSFMFGGGFGQSVDTGFGLANFGSTGLPNAGLQSKFDPNDYSAQGLDESAFTGAIPFKMPSFLMGGPAGDFSGGPAVLEPPPAPASQPIQPMPLSFPTDSGPGPPSKTDFNPDPSSPVFGMYGSSVVGVSADTRPFKKSKPNAKENDETSFLQRHDGRRRSGHQAGTPPQHESREEAFDASHLGLPPAAGGNFPGLYSESGFDLLGVLARVVARPNPTINVGPVDTSASFVVCDARRYDHPIVFASKTFSHLTGYDSSEILGRNCRFLQSPAGSVDKGSKRKDTDGRAVKHLQKHIESAKECQASLINYRKNGEPFINLVTIVPITWDSDEITYFVGFQVNLIEQPNAILDRMKNGTYVINYTLLPEPPGGFEPAREVPPHSDHSLAIRDTKKQKQQLALSADALNKLGDALAEDGSDTKKHWFETLIEQCEDMIHVLSLKGSLLYVSPAVERILGYSPGELLAKNLQAICHPSDWIAVMRELKESSQGEDPNVHLLYRVRRKNGSFAWIESQGRLYTENGKGRKCVILVARERPVYRMSWSELQASGGLGDEEVWYKVSLDGNYLYVAPSIDRVLGFEASAMVGTSVKQTLPPEYRKDFLSRIAQAAAGSKVSLHHQIYNRQRLPIEVVTHFWPSKPLSKRDGGFSGDMPESTFVICQTNEIKSEHRRIRANREFAGRNRPTSSSHSSYSGTPALVTREVATPGEAGQTSGTPAPAFSAVPSTYKFLRGHPASRRDNLFNELDTGHSSSWLYEIHLLENLNKKLTEERDALLAARSRRKRKLSDFQSSQSSSSDSSSAPRACANCGKVNSPEWRRGPGGVKSLCNACGLRWSKAQNASSSASTSTSNSARPESSASGSQPGSESRVSSAHGRYDSPSTLSIPPYHPHFLNGNQGPGSAHAISPAGSSSNDSHGGMPSRNSYMNM